MSAEKTRKIQYVAGSSLELGNPISDGRKSFAAGIVYEVSYSDMLRLTEHGDFIEVKDEVVAEAKEEDKSADETSNEEESETKTEEEAVVESEPEPIARPKRSGR